MSLISLEQFGTILNALKIKIKNSRGNWNQNDPNADNYIQNRTHYETVEDVTVEKTLTITWDGNTDGKVQATEDGELIPMYKISDEILTEEQLHDATCTMNGYTAPLKDTWDDELANGNVICREDITAFMNPPLCAVRAENVNIDGTSIVFPEPGIYSVNSGNGNYFSRIETTHTVMEKVNVVHHLDPKYIKDMYYSTSDVEETVLVNNLTFDSYDAGDAPQCNFIPGQKYSVIWNGTRYDNLVCYFDGEYNIIADGEPVPFYIDDDGGDGLYIDSEEDFESLTIIKIEETEIIYPVDDKYIPDTIARKTDATNVTVGAGLTSNKSDNITHIDIDDGALFILDGGFGFEPIEPGVYETGTSYSVRIASWDELVNSGEIIVEDGIASRGVVRSPLNEYGFHFDESYSHGGTYMYFHADGSVDEYYQGYLSESYPAGTAIYSQNRIDLSRAQMGVAEFSDHATFTLDGYTYYSYGTQAEYNGDISFPEDGSVTGIADNGFFRCKSITGIRFGENITSIGVEAFAETGIETVIFEDWCPLTEIGNKAFKSCSDLVNVFMSNTITNIGQQAFYGCGNITSIQFPESLVEIGQESFARTELKSIEVPMNVVTIGPSAFFACYRLENITFDDDSRLETIGEKAFQNTIISQITIPSSLVTIGNYAFSICRNLQEIIFKEDSNLTTIGTCAFNTCGSLMNINIPNKCQIIGNGAFVGTSITNIIIPSSVTIIDDSAFSELALTSIAFEENSNLETIGQYAFNKCTALASVDIPSSVTNIKNNAFYGCSAIQNVTIPSGVVTINTSTFSGCSALTSVIFNDDSQLKTIKKDAFNGCSSLESMIIPDCVTTIDGDAFGGCTNYIPNLPSSLTVLDSILAGKPITSVVIPSGVTLIDGSAFSRCTQLVDVSIPQGVTRINTYAFYHCDSLVTIDIPSSVTYFEDNVFRDCAALETIIIRATTPPAMKYYQLGIMYNVPSTVVIKVPKDSVSTYKSNSSWSQYASKIVAIEE